MEIIRSLPQDNVLGLFFRLGRFANRPYGWKNCHTFAFVMQRRS